jgi:prepilin-type N-terminal cleavage/methylation domain-containing protein
VATHKRLRGLATRLAHDESGFTLLELLNVLIIMSILLSIALPEYVSFKDKAAKAAAQSNVKTTVNAVMSYSLDNFPGSKNDPNATTTDSGYTGMTITALKTYDANIKSNVYVNNSGQPEAAGVTARATLDTTRFCVYSLVGRWYGYQLNTDGAIKSTSNSAAVCT